MMNNLVLEPKATYHIEGGYADKLKSHIKHNLNSSFPIRPYQEEAFKRFDFATGNNLKKENHKQLLFHMATGSGKTLIMAGLILDLYEKGYRNFIFFVNSTNIIEKTKDNFLNASSSKYLFNEIISISDRRIEIRETDNFEAVNDEDINIVFTTIQGLHTNLNTPKENSLTYEDFEDKKLVLLSDEAHHINTQTKRGGEGQLELSSEDKSPSWENTVEKIFKSNAENYLLEFTATMDLSDEKIKEKYKDKLLFDYPLRQFRIDGYSKEVNVLQADLKPFERALQAVLLNQYRRKVFESNQLHIKPVILLKSKTIKESQEFYEEFIVGVNSLTARQLEKMKEETSNDITRKVFSHLDKQNITLDGLVLELKNDFSEDKCIAVDSKNDSEEKQLIVNSLEDENNEYRAVFAVDKLNEGWDVLNLFDIVRLYNTQNTGGANRGKVGKTTMAEAQLIGRGARYCPFIASDDQQLYQRKYDNDIENELRICEELFYHSAHNPKYISELNKALQQIGIKPTRTVQKKLFLKDKFKETDFYKSGSIFVNERITNDRKDIHELDQSIRERIPKKKFITGKASISILIDGDQAEQINEYNKIHDLNSFSKPIIRKALNKLPFYRFSNLQRYFPHLKSMSEFIHDDKYLNTVKIELCGTSKQVNEPTNEMKLEATVSALDEISKMIPQGYVEYKGTKEFSPIGISTMFGKDENGKILNISINEDSDQEFGIGQTETTNIELCIDLSQEDWYAFNDNYGTSEEKYLVRYIKSVYEDFLKNKYDKVYLIRNERHFKLYSFDEGVPFEPDFVLFLKEKKTEKSIVYQMFIEPKGRDRLTNEDSEIKEKFLCQIEKEHKIKIVFENQEFKLIGLPLYNEETTKSEFDKSFKKFTQ